MKSYFIGVPIKETVDVDPVQVVDPRSQAGSASQVIRGEFDTIDLVLRSLTGHNKAPPGVDGEIGRASGRERV